MLFNKQSVCALADLWINMVKFSVFLSLKICFFLWLTRNNFSLNI